MKIEIQMKNGTTSGRARRAPFTESKERRTEQGALKNLYCTATYSSACEADIIAMGKESGDQIQMDGSTLPEGWGP